MFVVAFTANLLKRHPRCYKLVSRKQNEKVLRTVKKDPFREDEKDPMEARALQSCLWEIELVMKQHFDSKVRDYAKIFKTDILRKTSYFKIEELTTEDPIDLLLLDINEVSD